MYHYLLTTYVENREHPFFIFAPAFTSSTLVVTLPRRAERYRREARKRQTKTHDWLRLLTGSLETYWGDGLRTVVQEYQFCPTSSDRPARGRGAGGKLSCYHATIPCADPDPPFPAAPPCVDLYGTTDQDLTRITSKGASRRGARTSHTTALWYNLYTVLAVLLTVYSLASSRQCFAVWE
jgi:hypothetical protein